MRREERERERERAREKERSYIVVVSRDRAQAGKSERQMRETWGPRKCRVIATARLLAGICLPTSIAKRAEL